MIVSIYIGNQKLDLFEDEPIEITSKLVDSQDISKVFTDTSNAINVPATANNNAIFKHFYNDSVLNGWNIYEKTNGAIYINDILYKEVLVQLNDVVVKGEKPLSYNIDLFGLLSSLKDLVKEDLLNQLDLSALDFTTDYTTYISKLSAFNADVIATTMTDKRLIYDSDSARNNTDTVFNIALNNTSTDSGLNWFDLSFSIKVIKIIEAIETKYDLSFSRDFFKKNVFSDLYMLLKKKEEIEEQIVFDNSTDATLENDRILLSTNLTYSDTDTIRMYGNLFGAFQNEQIKIKVKSNDTVIYNKEILPLSDGSYDVSIKKTDYATFENLTFFFSSEKPVEFSFAISRRQPTFPFNTYVSSKSQSILSGSYSVSEQMPNIKVIDFLSGIIKKDKLIAVSSQYKDIFVNSLSDYYKAGTVINLDKYVDVSNVNIKRDKIISGIDFKFKNPQTFLQKNFFKINNYYYGDLEIINKNSSNTNENFLEISLPFENIVYERLEDLSGVDEPDFIYGYLVNESQESVDVSGHLHYVYLVPTSNFFIKILTDSSYTSVNTYNVPIHTLGVNTPQYSTTFKQEFSEYTGSLIQGTIYTNFHKDYIDDLFYDNRRIYVLKTKNLPVNIITNLALNDVLEIREKYYRINKYKVNLITRDCDFELTNIKNLDLTPVDAITIDTTLITTDTTEVTTDNNI